MQHMPSLSGIVDRSNRADLANLKRDRGLAAEDIHLDEIAHITSQSAHNSKEIGEWTVDDSDLLAGLEGC